MRSRHSSYTGGVTLTTLLIDSDIVAFKFAESNTTRTPWGQWTELDQAKQHMDDYVSELMVELKADAVVMALTDPEDNFRYRVMSDYKQRDRSGRSEILKELKEHLTHEYPSYLRPGLEADDVLGILATHPHLIGEGVDERIIVSEDKDLRTIPGRVFNPARPERGILDINVEQAAAFHMWQTIVGDSVDGFGGAPRVGSKSPYALDVLACPMSEMWDCVLEAFASVGLGEREALVNARMAKILTWQHYDFKTKEVLLWTPLHLLTQHKIEVDSPDWRASTRPAQTLSPATSSVS